MTNERTHNRMARILRCALWSVTLLSMLIACGCSNDAHESGSAVTYPTGISGDIEQQLKYDARVEGFDPGDADLTVNVNDSWLSSPPGMQERSVGQWYSLWHANHSGGVIIKHGDNKIASWTSAGFKPEPKSAGGESHSE